MVREPTLRRWQTVRSEDSSGELQGEPGESQPTESTDDDGARTDFWSIQVDLLHLSSSQWTSSSVLCAEGRNIPYSTKIFWCNKVYSDWSGRFARERCRWLLEFRFKQKLVRFVERFHEVYSIERKISQRIHVVRGVIDKNSNDCQTRSCMTKSMNLNW